MTTTVLANATPKPGLRDSVTFGVPTVFLSYSRKDELAAHWLLERLEETGRVKVLLDKEQIHPSEPWKPRLEALIRSADKVIFFLSEHSVAPTSQCLPELDFAEKLEKHIIPVVLRRVAEETVPLNLRARNYVFLDQPEYGDPLWAILAAVEQNIGWVREHTRIGELAYRWQGPLQRTTNGKVPPPTNDKLLRGKEIAIAEKWLADWPLTAPPPTPLHRQFVEHSRRIAIRSVRRLFMVLSIAGLTIASLGAWALLKRDEAEQQRDRADQTKERAETSEQIARREEAKALTQQSLAASRRHETTRGIELAVAAADLADDETIQEIELALYTAVWGHREVRRVQLQGVALGAEFDDDARVVVVGKQQRSYYDMGLNWQRSEQRSAPPRSAGISSLWNVASFLRPSKNKESSETRAWRRIDGDVDIVYDGEDLRVFFGKREAWTTGLSTLGDVMIDPNGRIIIFGVYQDVYTMNEDAVGTYSGTLKFLETNHPDQHHVLGEFDMLDRDWHDYVAIAPAGDTLVYADPVPAKSGQWREPMVITTGPGFLGGTRGDAGSVRATLGGHGQSLSSLDYSPDGSRILTLVPGGMLRLWSPDVFVDEESLETHRGARLGKLPMNAATAADDHSSATAASPRMRSFHRDVLSGAVTLHGGAGMVTSSLDGRVVHWPANDASPVVLYNDTDHPAVALAHAASVEDAGVYFVTIDGLHRVGLDGKLERLSTFEDIYSRSSGTYGSGASIRVVTGLTSNEPLVEIGTGRDIGLVVDVINRKVLWRGPCAERPRVDPRLGTLVCPLVPDELQRHEWPAMLYRRGDHLEEHDPYDPLVPIPQPIEMIPAGDCRRAVVGGALFDFEQGREIVRLADVPALQNAKLEGLPVFCSTHDLVGYARDLLSGVQRPGTPDPQPDASSPPGPVELPLPDFVVPPASTGIDPLALVGKLPTVLLQTQWSRVELNALLGEDLDDLDSRMEVTSEMERHGDLVIATGCMAHLCTQEEMALAIEIPTGRIHVAILTCPQQIRVYSPKGTTTPPKLQTLVSEMQSYAEAECG